MRPIRVGMVRSCMRGGVHHGRRTLQSANGNLYARINAYIESVCKHIHGGGEVTQPQPENIDPPRSLLLVDDDEPFLRSLDRAMTRRGFAVTTARTVKEGVEIARLRPPAYAVVDLRVDNGNGLDVVKTLHAARPDSRAIILTGFGSITTAVVAAKIGAVDYLSKPADADDITNALLAEEGSLPLPPEKPMSADRVRWEHIQRVYELCDRNVSETARRLDMHRRTLQRILAKRSPR